MGIFENNIQEFSNSIGLKLNSMLILSDLSPNQHMDLFAQTFPINVFYFVDLNFVNENKHPEYILSEP